MKLTRVSTGAVFLAYEQEDFKSVLEGEARARGAIAQMKSRLEAVRR
jgi:hypothetical protein